MQHFFSAITQISGEKESLHTIDDIRNRWVIREMAQHMCEFMKIPETERIVAMLDLENHFFSPESPASAEKLGHELRMFIIKHQQYIVDESSTSLQTPTKAADFFHPLQDVKKQNCAVNMSNIVENHTFK